MSKGKQIKLNDALSVDRVRFLFNYDPKTGDLTWRNPTSSLTPVGTKAGSIATNGRRYISMGIGLRVLAHRIAWLHAYGTLPEANISAKNGNYDDLRLENLEVQSFVQTALKNPLRSTNMSGYRGVHWDNQKKKWRAEYTKDYKNIFIGSYDTAEEAHEAYVQAMRKRKDAPTDPEERRVLAAKKVIESRIRRLWKRALDDNGGVVAWISFDHFFEDMSKVPIEPYMSLKRRDPTQLLGPANYQWVKNAEFDHNTKAGKLAYQRHHRSADPERTKNSDLKKSFGITLEQYRKILSEQGGVCAICRQPEMEMRLGRLYALSVDHCHSTGKIRGLLCTHCNNGVARFKDSPTLMRAAADYLDKYAGMSNIVQLKKKD